MATTITSASDHGVSEALYLRDPDQNGVELYWDRPQEEWPRTPDGKVVMFTRRLDVKELLKEVEANPKAGLLPKNWSSRNGSLVVG